MIIAEESIGSEPWHGTLSGTSNHRCKCLACRTVWNEYYVQRRKDRAPLITPGDPRHGTVSFYTNHGCRCAPCLRANTNAKYAQTQRKRAKATK